MATENQGIMSLPQGEQEAAPNMPQMGLNDSYDAVRGGLQEASPEAAAALQQTLSQIIPQLDQLPDEQLDALIQIFQYLHDHPEEYKEKVQDLVDHDVLEQGSLPDEYDPEVLAALLMVFMEAKRQRQMGNQREAQMSTMPQPPAGMARGGIAEAARMVASQGRSGDTMLAHINKKEAAMLRKRGGTGTINPATGLPEYNWWTDIRDAITAPVKAVASAVKTVVGGIVDAVKPLLSTPIGRILGTVALATVLGPTALGATLGGAGTAAFASGTITALSGGNIKDVLKSAATAYLGAPGGPVASFLGKAGEAMGVTNPVAQAAINAGLTGVGAGLLTGQSLKDSVKSGLVSGLIQGGITGAKSGFGTDVPKAPDILSQQAPVPGGLPPANKPLTPADVSQQISQTVDPFFHPDAVAAAAPAAPVSQQISQTVDPFFHPDAVQPPAGSAAPKPPPPVPTVSQALSQMGGGISDLAKGDFAQGYEALKSGASDLFFPSKLTPEQLVKTPTFQNARANGANYTEALKAASDAYNPGIVRTYAPAVAGGLGITALLGGFKPNTPPGSELANKMAGTPGLDLINANPRQYLTQNLPGVQYDQSGNIVGSGSWSPSATMADVRVPSAPAPAGATAYPSYAAFTPPVRSMYTPSMGTMYTPGPGTLGQNPQVYQPYNAQGMYTNLVPRYAAMGGMMDGGIASLAQGGYPRRRGQISGPGTETSDSIPAMLSDGEFVLTAKAVRGAGNGDRRAGAKKMYALMHQLERNASRG
jgi:hypothetical protein